MKAHTLIIAEAGVNHNGSIETALKLVDAAALAGVDYVKFQTFKSEKLVSSKAKKAAYQIENTNDAAETQLQMLKKLELNHEDHQVIIDHCKSKNIQFFSTAFDLDSLQYLADIGLELVKIPSGEITNYPYLKLAANLFKKIIISTGMATMEEIAQAVSVFTEEGKSLNDIAILHCNTEYPTPMEDVNLNAMINIRNVFHTEIGYSDHTNGIEVPIAAVALGASIIEKHFTLDKKMEGPDHAASLEPNELINMVAAIRNIEQAMSGSGIKEPSKSELKNIAIARKSIHANRDIRKGAIITELDLVMLRPGDGISPMQMNSIIGKTLVSDIDEGHKFDLKDFAN